MTSVEKFMITAVRNPAQRCSSFLLIFGLVFSGCSVFQSKEESKVNEPLVSGQYRLKEDREKFDELRAQEPETKKEQNDELAFMEGLFANPTVDPSKVREKYDRAATKKRELFNRDMQRIREDFVKKERLEREATNKDLENERKDFATTKHTSDERKDFYDRLDQKRKDFYAAQKLRRDDFEADMRDRRKNFDDYMREKSADFNERHRGYSKKYYDLKREKEKEKEKQNSNYLRTDE